MYTQARRWATRGLTAVAITTITAATIGLGQASASTDDKAVRYFTAQNTSTYALPVPKPVAWETDFTDPANPTVTVTVKNTSPHPTVTEVSIPCMSDDTKFVRLAPRQAKTVTLTLNDLAKSWITSTGRVDLFVDVQGATASISAKRWSKMVARGNTAGIAQHNVDLFTQGRYRAELTVTGDRPAGDTFSDNDVFALGTLYSVSGEIPAHGSAKPRR